ALLLLRQLGDALQHLLDARVLEVGAGEGIVGGRDVCLMVLRVLDLHRPRIDGGLERVVGRRETGERERHASSCRGGVVCAGGCLPNPGGPYTSTSEPSDSRATAPASSSSAI